MIRYLLSRIPSYIPFFPSSHLYPRNSFLSTPYPPSPLLQAHTSCWKPLLKTQENTPDVRSSLALFTLRPSPSLKTFTLQSGPHPPLRLSPSPQALTLPSTPIPSVSPLLPLRGPSPFLQFLTLPLGPPFPLFKP